MGSVASVAALLRRSRVERGALALLFALVTVTSGVVAASPRLFDRVADDGLRYQIAGTTAIQRNLQFTSVGQVRPGDGDPFQFVRARGDRLWDQLPGSVQGLVAGRGFIVDTARFALTDPPNYATKVTLRGQDGIDDHIRFVEGRPPARVVPAPDSTDPPSFEIALSRASAEAIKVRVGDRLAASVDPGDPLFSRVFPRPTTAVSFDVVGLFDVVDPTDPYWFDDTELADISVGGTEEYPVAYATALLGPDAFRDVDALALPSRLRWQFLIDPARLDAGRLDALVPDLRRLASTFGSSTASSGDAAYRTGLLTLIEAYRSARATTVVTLSLAALGPLAVAAGAVGLIALIIVRRRRTSLLLARDRGASARQLIVAQGWEGLLVTIPAAVLGLALAVLAVPARSSPVSTAGVLVVALAATALLVIATWPFARRARRDLEREDAPSRGPGVRRLVLEATLVGGAIAATWLLRERSLSAATSGDDQATVDPFLAAAPVLVGIAVGLVAIRLYPIPVRALAAVAARRRDLVPVLGLRSIGRHPGAAYLPLLVLTLTVAIGVFSSAVQATIERGQLEATWQAVGADYRVDTASGSPLPAELDLAGVAGIEAVADAISVSVQPAGDSGGSQTSTPLLAVDPVADTSVLAGTPAAVAFPPGVLAAPGEPGIGTLEDPIPAVVSARLPNGWLPRAVGDTFELQVRGQRLAFRIEAIAATFPGIPVASTFVVAPLASVVAAHTQSLIRPNVAFLRGPAEAGPPLDAALAATIAQERAHSRHELFAGLHDAPLVGAVGAGFGLALVVAAAYAALAVIAVIALDAQRRARELAYLRTLGLTDRQLVALTVVEHGPPVILALAIGVGLGLAVAWLLAPSLGLDVYVGSGAPIVLRVDGASVAAVMVATVVVVAVAIGGSSWLARRLDASEALRMGEV